MGSWTFHVDLDQFIAAVEVLRRPELAGKPVVVGGDGDPTKRGVVSTASYEAREFGVRSGMALRTALKRCPEAVFVAVDSEHYLKASREVMAALRSFPAVVQVLGWDEAFMAVASDDPESLAREVQRAVLERTRLWCSIGIGDNKLRAKLATGFAKPRGVFRLTRENWRAVMGARSTGALWGIGPKTARKLADLGIDTVEQLAAADDDTMKARFGPNTGPWIRQLGTGEHDSPVSAAPHVARGRGRERTFQQDIGDAAEVRAQVSRLARELFERDLANEPRDVVRAVVKIRFAPFFTSTHGAKLERPSRDPAVFEHAALEALSRFELDRPVRLVGVRAELAPPE
jgi:DNA polymerase-4